MVFAHGSGIDELAIFVFPVFLGLGFWLLTRQRAPDGETADDEAADGQAAAPVAAAKIASESPAAPKPVKGQISPFHSLIRSPSSGPDEDDDDDDLDPDPGVPRSTSNSSA